MDGFTGYARNLTLDVTTLSHDHERMPTSTERATALGVLIRERRKTLFPTMEAAAKAAQMSRVTWGDAERGTKLPQRGTLERIERVLRWTKGSTSDYLSGGPEPAPPAEVVMETEGSLVRIEVPAEGSHQALMLLTSLAGREDIPLSAEERADLIKIAREQYRRHNPESDSDS